MLNLKEVARWIKKEGKYTLIWERTEKYNMITDQAIYVRIPRYDAVMKEGSDLRSSFDEKEREQLLECERAIFYQFMSAPEENQKFRKSGNDVQMMMCDEHYEETMSKFRVGYVTDTNLAVIDDGRTTRIFLKNGKYVYVDNKYMKLVSEFTELNQMTEHDQLISVTLHTSLLISPIYRGEKGDSEYLKTY